MFGLGASLILVVLFLFTTDVSRMLAELGGANYWFVIPTIAMYFVSLWIRAMRWSVLSDPSNPSARGGCLQS